MSAPGARPTRLAWIAVAGAGIGPGPIVGSGRADWFEAISENFMVGGGYPLQVLERVRNDHRLVLHGVSLSIAGSDPLDPAYLRDLRRPAAGGGRG